MREWPGAGIKRQKKGGKKRGENRGGGVILFWNPDETGIFTRKELSSCNTKWFQGIINKYG